MPLVNAEEKLLRLGRQAQVMLTDALKQRICATIAEALSVKSFLRKRLRMYPLAQKRGTEKELYLITSSLIPALKIASFPYFAQWWLSNSFASCA
jgi:hypothetical protein